MRKLVGLSLFLVACLAYGGAARAESYEWQRMQRVLNQLKLELAEQPEDKKIAWIKVVSDDVLVKDEIWPTFLNWFHMTTREAVVRRELLFATDAPYHEARIEETMRNMRGMGIFALVRIVAVKTANPDEVGVVVHTRDLWSLRLETDFNVTTILDQFSVDLSERNFLGRNKALTVGFDYFPLNHSLSQSYFARRVWGSTVTFSESAGVVFNNKSGNSEGSLWGATLGEPYYNLKQKFSWLAQFDYSDTVVRGLHKRSYYTFTDPALGANGPVANDVYRQKLGTGSLFGYVRLGDRYKQTWGFGWDYRERRTAATRETMLAPELQQYFEQNVMPRNRTELGPAVNYNILMPEFVRFQNLGTYGLTENVRVGPHATLTARFPLRAFGSNSNSEVFSTTIGYIIAPKGFLLEGSFYGQTRYEEQRLVDQRIDALVRGATPLLFHSFRFVSRVTWTGRRNDTMNTYVALGGSNGLRGYTSQYLHALGASSLLANFEIRTLPVEWQAIHVGAVLFFDAGSVYKKVDEAQMFYAAGLGLRVLFPQLNRTPFSFDAGGGFDPSFRLVPTITDGQVVPLTAAEDPTN